MSAFALLVGAGLVRGVVYPRWIHPLLTIDERIAERQKELDKLEAEDAAVQQARYEYKALVARVGSFEVGKVETEVRDRLNRLIEKHHLQDASVSPSRAVEERKTGLWSTSISVSANGTLESTIAFLRDIAELPQLVRVGNPAISPAGSARRGQSQDVMSLRVPVDLLILPRNQVVGPIVAAELAHPDSFVRHAGRNYAEIWSRKPFSEYVAPIKLKATVIRTVNVEKGTPAALEVVVSGGDGEYTISWSPPEGLSDPTSLHPTVDTSTPGTKPYTLTVTDGSGGSDATATVVTVREPRPPEPVVQAQAPLPPPPPPPPGPKPWPDGRNMAICMALLRTLGAERLDEFMVYNNKSKETRYYKVGDDFDGGELVFVHQRGGVVRRSEDYFVYPIGATLDQQVEAGVADEYPELKSAAEKLREARQKRQAAPPVAPEAPADKATEAEPAELPDPPSGGLPADEDVKVVPAPDAKPAEGAEAKQGEPATVDEKPPAPKPTKPRPRPSRPPVRRTP